MERVKLGKDDDDKDVVKEISSVNPIADFNTMINDRKVDRVGEAISQMQKIIDLLSKLIYEVECH